MSFEKYKCVEYNDTIYRVPVRRIQQQDYVLLRDVQALVPNATALRSTDKLIPFVTDPVSLMEIQPKRVPVTEVDTAWQIHVPAETYALSSIEAKLDQLVQHLGRCLPTLSPTNAVDAVAGPSCSGSHHENEEEDEEEDEREDEEEVAEEEGHGGGETSRTIQPAAPTRPQSPPPAFSSSPPPPLPHANASTSGQPVRRGHLDGDAPPPSYETSILGNIKALTHKLRTYESHIPHRHKSPRWLARRNDWVEREPGTIEQVAYQLVQLEMALLWTAVSEAWIQERETWLTLVASARSERHLAGALVSLERHTLVMDDGWVAARERWVNELLEMVVLPLTHG
ncbi:hypothetical protein DFQ28_004765 [Apophysomyces sp. BC1034]|nr:hypothetical protein DFQ30_004632 [Apophysomyces sp. BC1015]KAG0178263.1 hypothetical protein DFQ29_003700 [Apophysomyces sp. BC1021]KAG0188502.1 hypothetical protein DFQ28_004765 [Apophysomyces sp. BC1034]